MDVNELKTWSRERLAGAARDRGVAGADYLTRSELLRLLSGDTRNARSPVQMARSFFRTLVERTFPLDPTPFVRDNLSTSASSSYTHHESAATHSLSEAPLSAPPNATSSSDEVEPIQTRTMARLLAEQGHKDRALSIYAVLVRKNPSDTLLIEERDELMLTGAISSAAAFISDHIEVTRMHATSIFARWELTPGGVRRASALCDGETKLTLRVVSIEADESATVTTTVRDLPAEGRVGEWLVADIRPHAMCVVSIGVGEGARFVSIAHKNAPSPETKPSN